MHLIKSCKPLIAAALWIPVALQGDDSSELPKTEPAPQATSPAISGVKVGPFNLEPRISVGVLYDNNIFLGNKNDPTRSKRHDWISSLTVGIQTGWGEYKSRSGTYVLADYAPTLNIFSREGSESAVDHRARIEAQRQWSSLTVKLSQDVDILSDGLVEAADRVDRDLFTTDLTAQYKYSDVISSDLELQQFIGHHEGLVDYNQWRAQKFVNYQAAKPVEVGLGVAGGYVNVRRAEDQRLIAGLARARYRPTERYFLEVVGGVEHRQFDGDLARTYPVFNVSSSYQVATATWFGIEAYHRDEVSVALANQNYFLTGAAGSVRHVFLEDYTLTLTGGYEVREYHRATEGVSTPREDDYFFVRSAADYRLNEHWNFELFHLFRENDSQGAGFDFNNHQVGVQSTYKF